MTEKEDMKGLLTKINALRADVLTKDWSDDKNFMMNGKIMYPYLSADKVKKTIAPLFHKHGLELVTNFTDLTERAEVGGFKQHWSIRLEATLIDVDTGAEITNVVYGEAGDVGDKGINKAQTAAIKQWIMSQFLIADGIDPERDSSMVTGGTYSPKTREENEEIKSKVLEKTVKPPAPAEKRPAPISPPAQKVAAPTAPAAPVEEIAGPQQKAMERIKTVLTEKASTDPNIPLDEILGDYANVTNQSEAIAFIKKYKEMTR